MVATLAAGAAVCTAPRDCTRERLGHSLQRTAATHVRYISLSLSLSLSLAAVCTAPRDCTRERLGHSLQRTAATHVRGLYVVPNGVPPI